MESVIPVFLLGALFSTVPGDLDLNRPLGGTLDCDPVDASTCPIEGESCYVNALTDSSVCASTFGPGLQQNQECVAVNDCAPGLSCTLFNSSVLTCAVSCNPKTGATSQGAFCNTVPELAGGLPLCVRLDEFYSNVDVPFGMCIDCADYADLPVCDPIFFNGFES